MKKALKNVKLRLRSVQVFVILLLKMCIIFSQETSTQKRIVIDVGHGGKDAGAIGINGIKEKDIVLDIANAILNLNNQLDKPLDIYLTRYKDTLISLSDRATLAKVLNVDLFVSLHCNHSDNPDARGIEVYVANAISKFSDDATWFAFQLQDELNKSLGFESRGVKFADFQVLRETLDYFPAVLLELGFLSNVDEHSYLLDTTNLKFVALSIFQTIQKK